MGVVLGFCLLVGFLILLPLLLGWLMLKLVVGLVVIPFKVAGLAIRLVLGLAFGVLALVLAGVALIAVPLVPIALLIGAIWLMVRLVRRPAPARFAA